MAFFKKIEVYNKREDVRHDDKKLSIGSNFEKNLQSFFWKKSFFLAQKCCLAAFFGRLSSKGLMKQSHSGVHVQTQGVNDIRCGDVS